MSVTVGCTLAANHSRLHCNYHLPYSTNNISFHIYFFSKMGEAFRFLHGR